MAVVEISSEGCRADAHFTIYYGNSPDDYTYSCLEHLRYMVADVPQQQLVKIEAESHQCCYVTHIEEIGRLFTLDTVNGDDANDGTSPEQAVKTEKRLWELVDTYSTPISRDVVYMLGAEDG